MSYNGLAERIKNEIIKGIFSKTSRIKYTRFTIKTVKRN